MNITLKKLWFVYSIITFSIGCARNDTSSLYLGQEPPGEVPEVFAPGIISTNGHVEMGCTWTPDGKEFYFARSETQDVNSNWAIWVVEEIDGNWTEPEIASFSGLYRDFSPFITPDKKNMLFYRMSSAEAEAREGTWIIEKKGDKWGEPRFLVEAYCLTTSDFHSFYFTTDYRDSTNRDIAMITYANETFSETQELKGEINSNEYDAHSWISADGSFLIFDSSRPGGFDNTDIYVCFRESDGSWTESFNLGKNINEGHHFIPSVTPDSEYIFFASDGDIYWVDATIISRIKPEVLK
jgi:Tol biopolymer transport system component